MKNAERSGIGSIALIVVAISASLGGAAHAEPARAPRAFGAVSCRANESSFPSDLGVRVSTKEAGRAGQSGSAVRRAAQVTRSDKADVTFEVGPAAGGSIEVSGRSGELQVKKTVQSSGDSVLELSTPQDRVTVTVTGQTTTVTRGGKTVDLRRNAAASDDGDQVRRLLADSHAVLRFRAVNAALIESDDRSPASLAFITSDAVTGLLTGDVGAPRRIAQFMARPGLSKVRRAGMAIDCYSLMEQRMTDAWTDYIGCVGSVLGFTYFQDLCAYRWVVQNESYWFNFISCSGFNF